MSFFLLLRVQNKIHWERLSVWSPVAFTALNSATSLTWHQTLFAATQYESDAAVPVNLQEVGLFDFPPSYHSYLRGIPSSSSGDVSSMISRFYEGKEHYYPMDIMQANFYDMPVLVTALQGEASVQMLSTVNVILEAEYISLYTRVSFN